MKSDYNSKNDVFKKIPSIPELLINSDGSIILFVDEIKNSTKEKRILIDKPKDRKIRKIINHNNKTLTVARLVFEAWIEKLPKYRQIKYIDGNNLNTHYNNLSPRPISESLCKNFKPVKGLNNVLINNNGTEVYQDNLKVNIIHLKYKGDNNYSYCTLNSFSGSKMFYISNLVASAWLNWSGRGHIAFIDKNINNYHYKNLKILSNAEYAKEMTKRMKDNGIIYKRTTIPKSQYKTVKTLLLKGVPLSKIANDFKCSDMSVHRLKVKLLTKAEI